MVLISLNPTKMTMDWQRLNIEIVNSDITGRHQGLVQWKFYYLVLYQVSNSQHISNVVNQIEIYVINYSWNHLWVNQVSNSQETTYEWVYRVNNNQNIIQFVNQFTISNQLHWEIMYEWVNQVSNSQHITKFVNQNEIFTFLKKIDRNIIIMNRSDIVL